jgi:hypothetical protein
MGQPGQQLLTAPENHGELDRSENLILCSSYNVPTLFLQNLLRRCLVCMVYSQAFCIIT